MTKVGGTRNDQHEGQDAIASDHDLRCELVTKGVFAIVTKDDKESKKEGGRKEYNDYHRISQVDMDAKCSVERHEAIHERIGKRRNRESRHGQRNQSHLKQYRVHRSIWSEVSEWGC